MDIAKNLLKMDKMARKKVYLFVCASNWMDSDLEKLLSKPCRFSCLSDFVYIYNILLENGISANVDIWDYTVKQKFNSLDEAVEKIIETYNLNLDEDLSVRKYLKRKLFVNKGFWLKNNRKVAMIHWNKSM